MTTPSVRAVAAPSVPLRANVLAHPSPTTGRFLLLIAAMLSTGLLVGDLFHNGVMSQSWYAAARACAIKANEAVPDQTSAVNQLAYNDVFVACIVPADRIRAWFGIGGMLLIALLGLAVLLLTPTYLRRREKLREAGERLEGARQRIRELAAEVGIAKPPKLLLGRAGQRDAFVFGLPGRYYLVLPTALVVRWKSPAYFDPVVRHELAHLKRHDVLLAWLASAVWVAAVPVALLPVVSSLVRWEFSILPDYLWRIALFLVVIWAIRRQALRSREHDADLHAARQGGDWRPLCAVLETATTSPAKGSWRRFISNHPTVAQRIAVLTDPGRARGVSIMDAAAGGLLASLLVPSISKTLGVLLVTTPVYQHVFLIVAVMVGPIAGLAVGVGLWRQAMIDTVTGERVWPGAAVLGFVSGLLLGHWSDFTDLGLSSNWVFSEPTLIIVGAATVLLSAGTGRLWADAVSRLPGGPKSWWLGFALNALIFAAALWLLQMLPVLFTAVLFEGLSIDGLLIGGGGVMGTVVYAPMAGAVIAALTMVRRQRTLPLPGWMLEGGQMAWPLSAREPRLGPALLGGAGAGAIAALGTLAYHLILGPSTEPAVVQSRLILWLLAGAGVASAVSFVTLVVVPRSGAAVGLVTGQTAALVAVFGTLALDALVFGNRPEPRLWWLIASTVTALWFLGYLVVLPVSLAMWWAPWRDVPGWLLATLSVIAGGVSTLCVVSLAIALR